MLNYWRTIYCVFVLITVRANMLRFVGRGHFLTILSFLLFIFTSICILAVYNKTGGTVKFVRNSIDNVVQRIMFNTLLLSFIKPLVKLLSTFMPLVFIVLVTCCIFEYLIDRNYTEVV